MVIPETVIKRKKTTVTYNVPTYFFLQSFIWRIQTFPVFHVDGSDFLRMSYSTLCICLSSDKRGLSHKLCVSKCLYVFSPHFYSIFRKCQYLELVICYLICTLAVLNIMHFISIFRGVARVRYKCRHLLSWGSVGVLDPRPWRVKWYLCWMSEFKGIILAPWPLSYLGGDEFYLRTRCQEWLVNLQE